MDIMCPCGGKCINNAEDVLKHIDNLHVPCESCKKSNLKKFTPLSEQVNIKEINSTWGRCKCGRRHLDLVMAHVLKIMMDDGLRDEKSNLRKVGTPLITPAYPLKDAPYLLEDSLVFLTDKINEKCALRIYNKVPEVKGILKGDLKATVGMKDSESTPHTYQLLAGCDLRCDLVQTPDGALCIYKNQGQIHLEFSKPVSPKITALYKVLGKYDSPIVLDCTCGPGTLGIAALNAGARKVVFNDIWYPATWTTALNLEINGFPVQLTKEKEGLIASGENFQVYCADIKKLTSILTEKFDICLVDPFPGVNFKDAIKSVKGIAKEVIIIE
ncbi:MAG TPA: 50S ribosomal protein L11 methyltransferase [Methanobacteriaceae archaeon]|nr:50S ribosomal protein L11 methyltransferase [Methanobacteriaceae archaeon]